MINALQSDLPASVCDALSAKVDASMPAYFKAELAPVSRAIHAQTSTSAVILRSIATKHVAQMKAQHVLSTSLVEFRNDMQLLRGTVEESLRKLGQLMDGTSCHSKEALVAQQLLSPREMMTQS